MKGGCIIKIAKIIDKIVINDQNTLNIYENLENPLFKVQEVMGLLGYKRPKMGSYLITPVIDRVSDYNRIKRLNKKNIPTWFINKEGLIEVLLYSRKRTAQEIKHEIMTLFFE